MFILFSQVYPSLPVFLVISTNYFDTNIVILYFFVHNATDTWWAMVKSWGSTCLYGRGIYLTGLLRWGTFPSTSSGTRICFTGPRRSLGETNLGGYIELLGPVSTSQYEMKFSDNQSKECNLIGCFVKNGPLYSSSGRYCVCQEPRFSEWHSTFGFGPCRLACLGNVWSLRGLRILFFSC